MEKDRRMTLCSIIGTIRTPTALFQTPSSTQNVLLERAGHRFLCRDHLMPCVKGSHSESISAGHCLIGEADCGRCFLKGFCQAASLLGRSLPRFTCNGIVDASKSMLHILLTSSVHHPHGFPYHCCPSH